MHRPTRPMTSRHPTPVAPAQAISEVAPSTTRTLLVHLRLPFQLLLAPIFLWGVLLAQPTHLTPRLLLAFVALHLFLYGGATAFNSYYDRDQGPVGGLERPPSVVPALLPFSLAVKATGALLAALVNGSFLAIYLTFAALSFAYSHPAVRLKAHPLASLAVVAIGQGVLAFLGAWAAARGEFASALTSPAGLLGILAATGIVLGFYPLTQLYQVDEDRARGDRTIAVAWGSRTCFTLALASQTIGGLALLTLLYRLFGPLDALLVGTGLAVYLAIVARWSARFNATRVLANFRLVSRLNTASALGLGLYFGARLALRALSL